MKTKLLTLLAFFTLSTAFAQGLNWGFEEWTTTPSGLEYPVGWETNQGAHNGNPRMYKDTNAVQGAFAARLVSASFTEWHQCESLLTTQITKALNTPKKLSFFLKTAPNDPEDGSWIMIRLDGWNVLWYSESVYPDYTLIEIPLPILENPPVALEIRASSYGNGHDGCENRSTVWLDGLAITDAGTTGTSAVIDANSFAIAPNPVHGSLQVAGPLEKVQQYRLVDVLGQVQEAGKRLPSQIKLAEPGHFWLVLELTSGEQVVLPFVNQ